MGGIETHVQVLCRELQKYVDVEVLVASDTTADDEFRDGDVKVTRVGTSFSASSAPVSFALPRLIRHAEADIIHLHLPNPPAILALLLSGYRGKVIATYHSDIVRQQFMGKLFEPILRLFLSRCAAIIPTTTRYMETSAIVSTYTDRCCVIPYGISLDQFRTRDEIQIARIRARYGSRLIISTGRLIYYKGFEYLIEAMTHIHGHLLIVGDGPLRERLQTLLEELGVQSKVSLLGEIHNDEIAPYFHAADVFALASVARSEAFGIVQLEAMACGKPVVNTALDSGVPSVSLDHVTGLTVPPRNPVALAQAINELLEDADLRASYGRAARVRVEKEFDKKLMAERVLSLYRRVLKAPVTISTSTLTESSAISSTPKLSGSTFDVI